MRLGSSVIVSLDPDADGQVRASVVSPVETAESTVTFALADQSSYRLLKITNQTKYILRMDVRVCIDQGTRCAESNVLPLGPGLSNYESWSEPIDLVLVSNLRLKRPSSYLCGAG